MLSILLTATIWGYAVLPAQAVSETDGVPYPRVVAAEAPFYPQEAMARLLSGTVEIEVTVELGRVVRTVVLSETHSVLSEASVDNVRTWWFVVGEPIQIVVLFEYQIDEGTTRWPENSAIEMKLPYLVRLTFRPTQPAVVRSFD